MRPPASIQRVMPTAMLVVFTSLIAGTSAAEHTEGTETYPSQLLVRVVRDSDLVVRGTITAIGSTSVPHDTLFVSKRPGTTFPMTTIEVAISHVIKGAWSEDKIVAVLRGDPKLGGFSWNISYDYAVGEEVVFCLRYNARIMNGVFEIPGNACAFFRHDESWVTRGIPVRKVPLEAIEREAMVVDIASMVEDADAVVLGSIVAVERKEFDCGFDITCTADYTTVRVTQAWKGPRAHDEIVVRAIRRGTNLSWYAPVPVLLVSQQYLMFLKRDEVGYYPFAGFNGFLKVDGEGLIMNDHMQYPRSRAETIAIVKQEVGP